MPGLIVKNTIFLLTFLALGIYPTAWSSPLDDRIQEFKKAAPPSESLVDSVLKAGLRENRQAIAYATIKGWLKGNTVRAQSSLLRVAQAAEFSGEWKDAAGFYRRLLRSKSVDAKLASEAVPAMYRLLINVMQDSEAAYLFMREEGNRLRPYGITRKFDKWFLEEAAKRNDFQAIAERLTTVYNRDGENLKLYRENESELLRGIETFDRNDESLFASLKKLVAAKYSGATTRARLNWVIEITPVIPKMIDLYESKRHLYESKQPILDSLLDSPLKAANALVAALPHEGSILVARGWLQYGPGHSPNVTAFVAPRREEKVAPILKVLPSLTIEQAQEVLSLKVQAARGRSVKDYLFSNEELRALIPKMPAVFNSLSGPDIPYWHKEMTMEEAQALTPHLQRNPYAGAAMVLAWARPDRNYSTASDYMMQSEMWRFNEVKALTHGLWHSGAFERDVDHDAPIKKYANLDARYQQFKKKVDPMANGKDRMFAFNALQADLLSPSPRMPGSLPMWDELFTNAPNADKLQMLTKLMTELHAGLMNNTQASVRQHYVRYLLTRAVTKSRFDQGHREQFGRQNVYAVLRLSPNIHDQGHHNWRTYGVRDLRSSLPEFAAKIDGLLRQQLKAGKLSGLMLSMWLHCVDPKTKEAKTLMELLKKSATYERLGVAYHEMAVLDDLFGASALTAKFNTTDTRFMSRELLDLPKEANPPQVEGALESIMTRLGKAPEPVLIHGLQKVIALPTWSPATRNHLISLLTQARSLERFPSRQGYEQLGLRILKEAKEGKQWGSTTTQIPALWAICEFPDHHNRDPLADALVDFAESALQDGHPSAVFSIARSGLSMKSKALDPSRSHDKTLAQNRLDRLRAAFTQAMQAIGAFEIPVEKNDPSYAIYKSYADYVQGNMDSAWDLYDKNDQSLQAVLRRLSADFGFWLLKRNVETSHPERAEQLVKDLTIWSREAEGSFTIEQEGKLKLAYADLAFGKGALPTSRAWYRRVADAREYKGTELFIEASLGSVKVDRVSKNYSAALDELEKLLRGNNDNFRSRLRFAKAEVLTDQENFKEAFDEVNQVLRSSPNHPDAHLLLSEIQRRMRMYVDASLVTIGARETDKVIVPGESLKIMLDDPSLRVSGLGVDIEITVRAKSGDEEHVMLYQFGDQPDRFRAEIPTELGPSVPGDKALQVLGVDSITFGYSKRFREKMDELPPDPKVVIGVASDAHLDLTAGAFPPRKGERRLRIREVGLETSQAALGTRAVRPGNPVYLRVNDPDRSISPELDKISLSLSTTSGDEIRMVELTETAPYSGEFQAIVQTARAQALAFASESEPGRDPNMAISAKPYPGWLGLVGDKGKERMYGMDLNDDVPLEKMSVEWLSEDTPLTHFVVQTSMNGTDWITRARYPEDTAPWDGRPLVTSFPTYRGGFSVSKRKERELPEDWHEKMERRSASPSCKYLAAYVSNITAKDLPVVDTGHPGYSGLIRFRALFYQPARAIRKFRLAHAIDENPDSEKKKGEADDTVGEFKADTLFLIDGNPANEEFEDPYLIERELEPGLHVIEVWRHGGRNVLLEERLQLFADVDGDDDLLPCPDTMFDPSAFPKGVLKEIPQPASISDKSEKGLIVQFGDRAQARLVRFSIQGFDGVAPGIKKITLSGRNGKEYLPVENDFMTLRQNDQLEVVPGDRIVARYEDPISATEKKNRNQASMLVAFNTATITASFLNYRDTENGRVLELESIRRFRHDDPLAIVIEDPDLDTGPKRDVIEFKVSASGGKEVIIQAVETEEHSGRFLGRVFPVEGEPERASEITIEQGGTLTAIYRDEENLDPGIPADRTVTIEHAKFSPPRLSVFEVSGKWLPKSDLEVVPSELKSKSGKRGIGIEEIEPLRSLDYREVTDEESGEHPVQLGASLRFDVVVPHLALAESSKIVAYVQTESGRKAAGKKLKEPFDVSVPGTIKLDGLLELPEIVTPIGHDLGRSAKPATSSPPLEEGRFAFSTPLILGDLPNRSYATKAADSLVSSAIPEGLVVRDGEKVFIGYAFLDDEEKVNWRTTQCKVESHSMLYVMDGGYKETLGSAFVGEKAYLRLLAPGLDIGPDRDKALVRLEAKSGAKSTFPLMETEAHSGVFKGAFTLTYGDGSTMNPLPPVELNGFPAIYGDEVTITMETDESNPHRRLSFQVNLGADGRVEPFSKRYSADEMAVRTSFTLAECYFELAKKHGEMAKKHAEQEEVELEKREDSYARRKINHAERLLAEALASYRDDSIKAHADYLLANLSQEFANLARNQKSKRQAQQEALMRYVKIPEDFPETEFAPKAQYKSAMVYEEMGQIENAIEEYVKVAYKYPKDELIPMVMSRLGDQFESKGQAFKDQADVFRDKEKEIKDGEELAGPDKAEILRLDELSYPHFLNAAMVFRKLYQRFPDHPISSMAGVRSGNNYFKSYQHKRASAMYVNVYENDEVEEIRLKAEAMFWHAVICERLLDRKKAYELYRRITFDYPDLIWAKRARGRLNDPAFARIIEMERVDRQRLLDQLKANR